MAEEEKGKCADHCQIFLSVFTIIMAIASLIFSIVVAASCEFIVVEISEGSNTANLTSLQNFTSLTYGQFRYNPDGQGCRKFTTNDNDVKWELITGQVGLLMATACLIVIVVLLLLQFCCCRFCCSRGIMIVLFILAIIGMAVTYLTYASTLCQGIRDGPYPCQAGSGTWYAVAALCFYIVTVFFFCISPKPKPLVQRIKDDKETDPCICCQKKVEKTEKDEEKAEQQPPAQAPPAPAPPVVQEEPDAAVKAVAAGAGAAAATNQMYGVERPPSQVVYAFDDLSEGKSSIGAVTVPFYMSADVVEGDLYFDANTVA